MNIQIVSDLHLEFPDNRIYLSDNPILPSGNVLILAGDIISEKYKNKAREFYGSWRKQFDLIIATMGNHEFYNGTIDYAFPSYKKQLAQNHYLINNAVIIHCNVKFIVSTLWSFVPMEKSYYIENSINDYRLISKKLSCETCPITSSDTNNYHKYSVKFIESELSKEYAGKIVVVTHHLPSYECIHPKWRQSELKYAFASDLNYLINKYKIDYWIFGHQHETTDLTISNTRFLSNPLGYLDEEQYVLFKSDWTFKL